MASILDPAAIGSTARRLWELVEPLAASVYYAPEPRAAYERLGLDSAASRYFCSRSAALGAAPGEVVAAAFAVFEPAVVVPAVAQGWAMTTPEAVASARLEGARAALRRLLGDRAEGEAVRRAADLLAGAARAGVPEGRPVFAGLLALGPPGDAVGDLWWAADLVREHRGGSHVLAWGAMHLSPVEIGVLTELWWRMVPGTHVRTRGWSPERIEAGVASLRRRGFVDGDPPVFTSQGRQLREVVEEMTDQGESEIVAALGGDAEDVLDLLGPLTDAVLAAKGYPRDPAVIGRN